MGTVWLAHDEMLDREVAVKEVRLPERLTVGERRLACRRMVEEARATAALRHPGVVQVFDILMEDGRPWIIMEYLKARSLHAVLAQDGRLPAARAAEVGLALLSVLRTAHTAGILHRDVKPSNVLLCDDGRVLLTDFGLAVHINGGRQLEDTLVSGIEGSPAYLPPERVRGLPSVPASDLWSLGATLYAALEGRSPFLRCHALASMVAVLLGEYEPPRASRTLAPVVEGLLREDPDERLTADDVEELLRDALRTLPNEADATEGLAVSTAETTRSTNIADGSARPAGVAAQSDRSTSDGNAPPAAVVDEAADVATSLKAGSLKQAGPYEPFDKNADAYGLADKNAVYGTGGGRGSVRRAAVRMPASRRPRLGALLGLGAALAGVAALGAWSARWTSVSKSASAVLQPVPGASAPTTVFHAEGAFSVEVPANWHNHHVRNGVAWKAPSGDEGLTIVRAPGDALSGLHADERSATADGAYPGYRRLRLEPAPDLARDAAEWEFTWNRDGGTRALRSRVAGYEFFFYTRASRWTPGARLYDRILRSFDPEPSTGN
ncbi:tRNA A-37 threonylcarbamoyl transferase component Bud32 [Actinomadura rupiterrae]|nr:tRNA A-37 threonylcarbamoyl transferase component Bud32 [Actinomadura rupiterrae]